MLSTGSFRGWAVLDVVALPVPGGRTLSRAAVALSPEAGTLSVPTVLSGLTDRLSAAACFVLSEAGACAAAIGGTIKEANPSQVAGRVKCRDMTTLRFELGATQSF
jgi:hypothetical protein